MSELVHYEYPPPRSWEQFEELCADLFEAMWSDPGLVRHGRAGQVQYGVDIIATYGGRYPIGLQCKKKSQWPLKKLTSAEIEDEVIEAEKFTPALEEFYILTTAVSDQSLQAFVRQLNEERERDAKFPVTVLFWPEIVRRVARFEQVAKKHFPIGGTGEDFSPLLATWYTKNGQLELSSQEWHLAVSELGEDFHEWPMGHVVVRQRETDAKMAELQKMDLQPRSEEKRIEKIKLRRKLRNLREKEHRVQEIIRILYTIDPLKFYMLDLDETGVDAAEILRRVIESAVSQDLSNVNSQKVRVSPPSPHLLSGPRSSNTVAADDLAISIPSAEYLNIMEGEVAFPEKYYGNSIVQVVSELPPSVKFSYVIPQIINRILRIMKEDMKTIEEMRIAGYLDIYAWTYEY